MSRHQALGWIVLALVATLGCGGGLPEEVSDTGYEGTWQRGNERIKSTVSIVELDGEYRFRWSKTSSDGKVRVLCDWQGRCDEFVEGERLSEFAFRTWVDEGSGHLRVECKGEVFKPEPRTIHYVDELIVNKDGLTLVSHTIEDLNGTHEIGKGPKRTLRKISDHVSDPPEGWSPPGV